VEPVEAPRPATHVERGEAVVKALAWAVRRAGGRPPVFGGVPGSTDGTILRTALGIPIVTFGPGDRLIPHQVNECVLVTQLVEAARCYALAAMRFLSRG
jgi:succinyl-diaminopimelate desuccinylase